MAIIITCPKTGLVWTAQDDYNSQCFIGSVHPLYSQLPKIIKKEKWKTPSSYLVAGIFHYLTENNLITITNTEPPLTRPIISKTISIAYTASQLYALYTKFRDSKIPLIHSPVRINLTTLAEQSAKTMWTGLEAIALQSLSEADRNQLYVESHRIKRKTTLRLNSAKKIVKTQSMAQVDAVTRISKLLLPLYDNLCKDNSITLPINISRITIQKASKTLPDFSIINSNLQKELNYIITTVFDIAIKNSFLSMDSIEYRSYFNLRMQMEQKLTPSNNILDLIF